MSDAEHLNIQAGRTFVLSLAANPSAGYKWAAEFDPVFLRLIGKQIVHQDAGPMGAGVTERFEFEALMRGTTQMQMIYRRPWETTIADKKTYIVQIT